MQEYLQLQELIDLAFMTKSCSTMEVLNKWLTATILIARNIFLPKSFQDSSAHCTIHQRIAVAPLGMILHKIAVILIHFRCYYYTLEYIAGIGCR